MKDNLTPNKDSFETKNILISSNVCRGFRYLVQDGVLADKYKEDKAAPEKVDTSNDPEDKLSGGDTFYILMVSMDKVVDAFKYQEDPHHYE